jgi:hypothetical protein
MYTGSMTKIADAAQSTKHLLVKFGSDADHIAVNGASDKAIGTCPDTPAAGDSAAVLLLGCANQSRTMVASEAISAGADVFAAAGGKVASTGTVKVGVALQAAAADGDEIEVDPCVPA